MSLVSVLLIIWTVIAGTVVTLINCLTGKKAKKRPIDPKLLQDHYWSREEGKVDQTVYDYSIDVSDEVLSDLKKRLESTRIFDSHQGTNFHYGLRSDVLKNIINHWCNNYDWKRVEHELNQLPHFTTIVEGLSIHFIHVKAKNPTRDTLPIMLVHGWPGSFFEFVKSIPHLEDDFNLVIPSIPGYGFSQAPEKPGCSPPHVARIFNKLMKRLGYSRFVYQGGDWGALIGNYMAAMYPDDVLGLHLNMPSGGRGFSEMLKLFLAHYMPNVIHNDPNTVDEQKVTLFSILKLLWSEMGYAHIQATKPDTVAYALNDSPAGLAAYILEKFSTWTHKRNLDLPDGGLYEKFSLDELLTNVTIYWVNGNITSSVRLYKEAMSSMGSVYITVPTGLSPGRQEIINMPQSLLVNTYGNIIHYNNKLDAGHFLFFESPKAATDDLKRFISKLRSII